MILAYKFSLLRIEAKSIEKLGFSDKASPNSASSLANCQSITRATANKLGKEMNSTLPQHVRTPASTLCSFTRTRTLPSDWQRAGNHRDDYGRLEIAAEQQESELSMLRYLAWAIPSIGFIGTVRGIGVALMRADEALTGDLRV